MTSESTVPHLDVELADPPAARWAGLAPYRSAAKQLIASYAQEIGGGQLVPDLLGAFCEGYVEKEYVEEMRAVSRILGISETDVLLSNLYYDALKVVMGCTGFAVDDASGPLHARNLDWGTTDRMLSRHTIVLDYRWRGELRYRVVGWPGYLGALSGIAPGRFALSLNAVLSEDAPELAQPVTFLLRTLLARAVSFDDVVRTLAHVEIASDCLLLATGTRGGEIAVVERTPKRSAVRGPANGAVVVTNDYRSLAARSDGVTGLVGTSCGRFDRASALVAATHPRTPEACFAILRDEGVRMEITVQSMVFRAATGDLIVRV